MESGNQGSWGNCVERIQHLTNTVGVEEKIKQGSKEKGGEEIQELIEETTDMH